MCPPQLVNMAADGGDMPMTFALPDLSGLTEAERLQVIAVMHRAKEFEEQEKMKSPRPKMEGQLLKYTNVMKGWQTRWFLLDPDIGLLEYFEKEEHKKQRPRGSVHLAAAIVSPSDEDSQTFMVTAANGEAFKLRASDARERQHWVDRLRSTAEYHTANIAQNPGAYQNVRDGGGKEGTPRRLEASQRHKGQYSSEESVHSTPGTSRRRVAEESVANMNTPFGEVQEYLMEAQEYSQRLVEKIATLPYTAPDCFMTGLDKDLLMLKATSGATITCIEQCLCLLQGGQATKSTGIVHSASMPVSVTATKPPAMSPSLPLELTISQGGGPAISPAESYATAKSVPYNFLAPKPCEEILHEDEVEDKDMYIDSELGGVEEHKSVILHLLSQLKLGMDLTKVVLPTFILERRSLLEMFADCMAHPDLFLSIPDIKSPEERMMMVLEWYLTSFHAGRQELSSLLVNRQVLVLNEFIVLRSSAGHVVQGSVAKKPYNPIIGETFHCCWKIPTVYEDESESAYTLDKEMCLLYCAEQVSHHPPVSAFYFECPDKKVCMNASIWTKSKFMGMSIGVVMVGKVSLHLLELGEEYVFSLPSAYARSILTVPWVELGDKIGITCEKTGLAANVTFHTKPFYGGKLHRISAEVKDTATSASLCRVSGEWNGTLEFTYTDGQVKEIDTQKLKVWRKCVRPLDMQGDFESRKLWRHVTNALNVGDVNTATEHKRLLEERQREGERHRKDSAVSFPTKYFYKEGDQWQYNKMLSMESLSTCV